MVSFFEIAELVGIDETEFYEYGEDAEELFEGLFDALYEFNKVAQGQEINYMFLDIVIPPIADLLIQGKTQQEILNISLDDIFPEAHEVRLEDVKIRELVAIFMYHIYNCSECRGIIKKLERKQAVKTAEEIVSKPHEALLSKEELSQKQEALTKRFLSLGMPEKIEKYLDKKIEKERESTEVDALQAILVYYLHHNGDLEDGEAIHDFVESYKHLGSLSSELYRDAQNLEI